MAAPIVTCRSRFWCLRRRCFRQIVLRLSHAQSSTAADPESQSTAFNPSSASKSTVVQLEDSVSQAIENGSLKHKHHPGRLVLSTVSLPTRLTDAVTVILEKYPVKELSRKADKLANYMWSRHPPCTDQYITDMANKAYQQILQKKKEKNQDTSLIQMEEVLKEVRRKVYHWQPVTFDAYKSLLYLTGNLAQNYAVLLQCFTELSKRDPEFQPRSIYNLGSGLGSSVWASNTVWGSRVFEHYCVDHSQDMNTVARLLLQDGDSQKQMSIPGVVFRQFAPSAATNQFDMVVCAYTLLDQPGRQQRQQLIDDLWRLTSDVLVLVENGTYAGSSLINEARDRLLQASNSTENDSEKGYVFAPCPHDSACPKFVERNQPCNFQLFFKSLKQNHTQADKCSTKYSYIIMRKGKRSNEVPRPRVVQETVKAKKHTHCHLCCADGKIRHMIFTAKKHADGVYKCSRYLSWGDHFPVHLSNDEET